MTDTNDTPERDLEDVDGELLPPREVMSLLTTGGALAPALPVDGLQPGPGPPPDPRPDAGPAAGEAGSPADEYVQADGPASEEESTGADDRESVFSSSDSATAGDS